MSVGKYLTKAQIDAIIGKLEVSINFVPMSQDSYNEESIAKAVLATGKESQLLEATLNMAVVGIGNQKYGFFRNGDSVVDIGQLLDTCGVKLRLPINAVLKEDDLTVQRLCRFFRHHIRDWLKSTGYQTYIYRKYSRHDPNLNHVLFRGAEYLDDLSEQEEDELAYSIATMDSQLKTNIFGRYERIRQAQKGILRIMDQTKRPV
jgi:hypothetical protein